MVDILHQVGVKDASADDAYRALTTLDGLSGWWTENTSGDPSLDGVIRFRFEPGDIDMKVVAFDPASRVRWEVVDGPAEWIGTHVDFALEPDGEYTLVRFRHEGWAEPVPFMHHCTTKWGVFLLSLKSLLETGTGAPAPRDTKIDSWN